MVWTSGVSVHELGRASKRMAAASPSLAAGSSLVRTPTRTAVYVSDCRVMLACEKYEKGSTWVSPPAVAAAATVVSTVRAARRRRGKVMVGQIRYESIKRIGASPPIQGRHLLAIIALEYPDLGTTKSLHLHLLRGGPEPVVVAQDIAQRAAAFRLHHDPDMPADERTSLEALVHAERLVPTAKVWGYYDLPGSQPPRALPG